MMGDAECSFKAIYTIYRKARILQIVRRARLYSVFISHRDTQSFVSFLFFSFMYSGSGIIFLMSLQSFEFGNNCQQRELPLFGVLQRQKWGSFFLLWGV